MQLEQQVETLEQVNNKILNSIYWTLGTLSTIFTAFLALNFFSNLSINRKKIEAIKEELENKLDKSVQEIDTDFKDRLGQNKSDLQKEIEKKVNGQFSTQNTKIQTIDEQVNSKIDFIDKKVEGYSKGTMECFDEIAKNFDDRVKSIINPKIEIINSDIHDLSKKDHELERSILSMEMNDMSIAPGNRRRRCIEILELDIKQGWDFRINETLQNLVNFIKDEDLKLKDIGEIKIKIEKLDQEKYSFHVEKILELLKTKNGI